MSYKYAYVLEDSEIEHLMLIDDEVSEAEFVNNVCDEYFEEEFNEVDVEKNGVLYSVNEVQQVFLTNIKTNDYEELFR